MPDPHPRRASRSISGNWKMNLNHWETVATLDKLRYLLSDDDLAEVEVSVHPPFTDIRSAQTLLESEKVDIALGAQNCHWEEKGAFTGEISPAFLAKLNVRYVIVGHSERRELFGETDEDVNRKAKAVLAHGMVPILCVGETLDEREAGTTEAKVTGQVRAGLAKLSARTGRRPRHRLRTDLGDRHRAHRDVGRRAGGVRLDPRHGGRGQRSPTRPRRCGSSTAGRSSPTTRPS